MLASFDFCITLLLASYIFGCHVVMRLGNCSAHPLILLYHRGAPKERSHIRYDMYPPFLASMCVFYKLVFCLLSFLCDVHSKIVRRWDCKDFLSHKLKKEICQSSICYFSHNSSASQWHLLLFLYPLSMERGGRLVMRMGTGNQSNGYVGTTLCLLSLLFHTNSIKKYVNFVFLKILRHHQGISFFS